MRLAYLLTHPIQYQSPLIRSLVEGGIEIHVAYATDTTSRAFHDVEFGRSVTWDVPLLEGYSHTLLNRDAPRGSASALRRLYADQIRSHLQKHPADAMWVHGWSHPFTLAAWDVAAETRKPLMLRGETFLGCIKGGHLRRLAHRWVYSKRFRRASAFLAVGTLNRQLYRAYGAPENCIFSVPYAVDNAFFQATASQAKGAREILRGSLGIEPGRPIVLFCGKLIPKKDPATLIRALGQLKKGPQSPVLVVVGDGELRSPLEALAEEVLPGATRFLGFKNQTEIPVYYDLCDVFVIPSLFEPWGLVVNEVMNAGKPVIVSNQVGSGPDLVEPGINGDVFKAGDAADLAQKLTPYLSDPEFCQEAGRRSLARIHSWSFEECLTGMKLALAHLSRR
jgi:glycosyltransferase involved in cell wall biosynthesis